MSPDPGRDAAAKAYSEPLGATWRLRAECDFSAGWDAGYHAGQRAVNAELVAALEEWRAAVGNVCRHLLKYDGEQDGTLCGNEKCQEIGRLRAALKAVGDII